MPSLCDVNVLFALTYRKHLAHSAAASWLQGVKSEGEIVLCRMSQLGLLRLLNSRVVMREDALSVAESWAVYDYMMSDQRFVYRDEPRNLDTALRGLMRGRGFVPNVWADAYLASFAVASELSFVTFDSGFRQFKGLDLVTLG
jgi:toxin-antitoxin system PIN domain toxin